jgi:hypothetical protein
MMLDAVSSERVAEDVLALLMGAARARVRMNLPVMVEGLVAAVELYEQYPTEVHSGRSEMRKLLAFIRHAAGVHRELDYPDRQLQDLEARAEALRRPLH